MIGMQNLLFLEIAINLEFLDPNSDSLIIFNERKIPVFFMVGKILFLLISSYVWRHYPHVIIYAGPSMTVTYLKRMTSTTSYS